jgi:hypothetical protein
MSIIQTPNGYSLDNSGQRIVVDPVTRIEIILSEMRSRQEQCGVA